MTFGRIAAYVLLDTTVVAHLTKRSEHTAAHERVIVDRSAAISFQTDAELLSAGYAPSRQLRLDRLRASFLYLPHSRATSAWYARVGNVRKTLRSRAKPGGNAGDADVWIIASSLEFGLVLVTHDRQQFLLADAAGASVFANLRDIRHLSVDFGVPGR